MGTLPSHKHHHHPSLPQQHCLGLPPSCHSKPAVSHQAVVESAAATALGAAGPRFCALLASLSFSLSLAAEQLSISQENRIQTTAWLWATAVVKNTGSCQAVD